MSIWSVYIVQCKDGTYYTGISTDVDRRVKEHNGSSKGAKYTSSRRPVILMWSEIQESQSVALKRELAIKKLSRTQKETLWKSSKDI
jgi:predicted GIY-YIG superfamily endonuclease